jgi:hypothetical protein
VHLVRLYLTTDQLLKAGTNAVQVPSRAPSRVQSASTRFITYLRGHITVIDRPGLEARCCECHAVVKTAYDRFLPAIAAS